MHAERGAHRQRAALQAQVDVALDLYVGEQAAGKVGMVITGTMPLMEPHPFLWGGRAAAAGYSNCLMMRDKAKQAMDCRCEVLAVTDVER